MLRLSLRAVPGCGGVLRRSLCSNAVGEYQAGKGAVGSVAEPQYDKASISQFTGVPLSQLNTRMVKIFNQSQGVQNGNQNTMSWKMQWEDNQTKRWTNPLMGWSSTNDPLSNTHMTMEFHSSDAAVRFCEQNGWKYTVVQPKPHAELVRTPKKYADNFKWKGGPGHRPFPDLYIPPPPPKK